MHCRETFEGFMIEKQSKCPEFIRKSVGRLALRLPPDPQGSDIANSSRSTVPPEDVRRG